jgi:hypothetical protein
VPCPRKEKLLWECRAETYSKVRGGVLEKVRCSWDEFSRQNNICKDFETRYSTAYSRNLVFKFNELVYQMRKMMMY